MKYIDEFRDPDFVRELKRKIEEIAPSVPIKIMEVCGTHTMSIRRFGLQFLLPQNVELISGPGCPVCVTPNRYIDTAIALSQNRNVIISTFGDMVRVPGSRSSLEREKSKGANVAVVYSPYDSLRIAESHPDKKVVFLAVGFETTAPLIAATILEAEKRNIKNFFILPGNKLVPPALSLLLEDKEIGISGFLLPGHVSTVIGTEPYKFIAEEYGVPCAVAGFEPVDILQGIYLILNDMAAGKATVRNAYTRAVRREGNPRAIEIMKKVFREENSEWRGIGSIEKSGLVPKNEFAEFDIRNHVKVEIEEPRENPLCRCGDVLKGKAKPPDCPLFKKACTPENPYGPCMVSSEGTCAAYYKYGG